MTYASGGRARHQRRKQDCSGLSVLSYLGAQEFSQLAQDTPSLVISAICVRDSGRPLYLAKSRVHHLGHARSGGVKGLENQNDYTRQRLSVSFTEAAKRRELLRLSRE